MKCITVIASIQAKKDQIEFVKSQLCKLVKPTRREFGNINYMFYQDRNNPSFFHSYENWINKEVIEKHLKTKHIQEYLENTKDAVSNFEIKYFNKICD